MPLLLPLKLLEVVVIFQLATLREDGFIAKK